MLRRCDEYTNRFLVLYLVEVMRLGVHKFLHLRNYRKIYTQSPEIFYFLYKLLICEIDYSYNKLGKSKK